MPDAQPLNPEFRTFMISAGGINADRIEAGTIPDPDGTLAAMTEQLIADLQAGTIEAGRPSTDATV